MNIVLQKVLGGFTGWAGDGPWRSKSVLAALAAVVAGLGLWCSDLKSGPPQNETNSAPGITQSQPAGSHWKGSKPFPFYTRMGASYVAGFCLGWFFRKLTRLIMVVTALAIALLAFGKFVGCNTTHEQEEVKRGGAWAQHEATAAENYFKHLMPSAATGGAGIFLGFRRRSKTAASAPPEPAV